MQSGGEATVYKSLFVLLILEVSMKSDNFVVVQGWMCNELGLKGNELLVFALINGFSQDETSSFCGGRKYIADSFNISLPTVDKALDSLVEKEYVVKQKNPDSMGTDKYSVNQGVVKKLYGGSKESLLGGGKETLPKNISNKNIDKKQNKNNSKELLQTADIVEKKPSLYTKCVALINAKTEDEEERELLTDWLKMLLEKYRGKGKVLYANIFKGKLKMLDDFNRSEWKAVILYNTQKGYEGFYPIRNNNYYNAKKVWEENVHSTSYTDEEQEEQEKWREEMRRQGKRVDF